MGVSRSLAMLLFGLGLAGADEARAQPLVGRTESIESTMINSDLVFIATLVDFRAAKEGEDVYGHEATIAIEKTLKQELFNDEPYHRLSVHLPRPASVLLDWQERSCRLLVALKENSNEPTTVIELSLDRLEVMTADVRLLRDQEAVIQAARAAVDRLPANVKRVHTFKLHVPRDVVAGTSWEQFYETGGFLGLIVPVDRHLERRAQDSVRSENPRLRGEGARALVYFKSDENLAIIRPLLNDPAITYSQPAQGDQAGERLYGVRYHAYQTLKAWNVDVEQPVYREEVR